MQRRWQWAVAVVAVLLGGFWALLPALADRQSAAALGPASGTVQLPGLAASVSVRRDAYGVPLIEAQDIGDLAFATGYVMAQDRYSQMVGMTLVAQGRLAERVGSVAFPLDLYMRTLGIRQIAQAHYTRVPGDLAQALQRFADGVNAWADSHADRLPFGQAGFAPEPWTPLNSMDVYVLLNLGLSLNLHQELAFLAAANRVGPEQAAWLFPTMPDEPLPLEEARKLLQPAAAAVGDEAEALAALHAQIEALVMPLGLAASNNWVIAPSRTAGGASILANDTHLLLQHPPLWMQLQLRAPGYNAAGIAVAGVPGIVAGYNGHVAWGMTMVMADGQDLFVEQLRGGRDGGIRYRNADGWKPLQTRRETFHIHGRGEPVHVTIRSTERGPLLGDVLRGPAVNALQPFPQSFGDERHALSLAWTVREPDDSLAALWQLAQATDFAQAGEAARGIRYIHLNLVYADRDNIGWQVTGRYPRRLGGTGKFPSPAWTGEYGWDGWLAPGEHPAVVNPVAGFLGTANDRKLVPAEAARYSSSWFYPERGERVDQLLAARSDHSRDSVIAMQADQHNLFAAKLRAVLLAEPFAGELRTAIAALPERDRLRAMEALTALGSWDGDMRADSREAAIFGLFQGEFPRQAFLDELGPEDSAAWRGLVKDHHIAYSATQDHLLQREDSPFWDDLRTPDKTETKADIVARTLAAAIARAEQYMGSDRARWQWGSIHTYTWRSPASELREHLPWLQRLLLGRLSGWLDRGPYPAGGDHNTLNVAGHGVGEGYDVHVVPAMRLVVDFSAAEPLSLVIAGGQSDNPASPHYDDGIALWLSGGNRVLPFNDAAARAAHFSRQLLLEPAPVAATPAAASTLPEH